MAGQQAGEKRQRPLLQRLGQKRVIGVGEGGTGYLPGAHPSSNRCSSTSSRISSATAIEGCVSLSCTAKLSGKRVQALPAQQVDADHVLERAGDEEILLRQAQLLADLRLVVGIEDLGDGLRDDLLVDGAGSNRPR